VKQYLCRVADIRTLVSNVSLLTFDAPELALALHPGQFVLVRDPAQVDPYLRRTAWLYDIAGSRVELTLPLGDRLVTRIRVGDTLDLLAPLGRAVEFGEGDRHILLIGESGRTTTLLAIARNALEQERAVVLLTRTTSTEAPFPAYLLPPEVEYHTDGDAPSGELFTWADQIVASGSTQLYHDLAGWVRRARYRLEPGWARVLMDLPMPCGTGACFACAIDTSRGIRLACYDGPAFDLAELENVKAL
jgi:dihydroorotate dehydrogenase electron transfer subunit